MQWKLSIQCVLAIIATVLGSGFQHGYNFIQFPYGNSNSYIKLGKMKSSSPIPWFQLSHGTFFQLGWLIGASLISPVANKLGRKGGILFGNIFTIAGVTAEACAYFFSEYWSLYAGRFSMGINCGLNVGLAPLYLIEISPTEVRALVASIFPLIMNIGAVLTIYIAWPWMNLLIVLMAIFQILILGCVCPESPAYLLIAKFDDDEAHNALATLRCSGLHIQNDLYDLRAERDLVATQTGSTLISLPLLTCSLLIVLAQFSGIRDLYQIAPNILINFFGLSQYTSGMIVGMTFIGGILFCIFTADLIGRKPLIAITVTFLCIINLVIFFGYKEHYEEATWELYVTHILSLLAIFVHSMAFLTLPVILAVEIFDERTRAATISIIMLLNFGLHFLAGYIDEGIWESVEEYTFILQTITLFFLSIFSFKCVRVPETKGKTFADIKYYFE